MWGGSVTPPKWLILANPCGGVTCRFVPWGQLSGETQGVPAVAAVPGCHCILCWGSQGHGGGTRPLNQSRGPGSTPLAPNRPPPSAAFGDSSADVTVPEPRGRPPATSWPRPCPCRRGRGSRSGSSRAGERVLGDPRVPPWQWHCVLLVSPAPGHPETAKVSQAQRGVRPAPAGPEKS